MGDDGLSTYLRLFRMDAARWVRPSEIADISEVTPGAIAKLLFRNLSLRAVGWYRVACFLKNNGVPALPQLIQRHMMKAYGLEMVPGRDPVGGGLYIAHPVGCTLVARSIGTNVSVVAAVTFGMRNEPAWPRIGDEVFVGAGARVLGDIHVGDGARVGANAVVVNDVPAGATVVGIPARLL